MRSSLTCPLVLQGHPVGFLYFTSDQPGVYANAHVEFFSQIADQLAMILEKGRLYSALAEKAEIIAAQNVRMKHELEMARTLQRALIPRRPLRFEGVDAAFAYEPATAIGGDLLDLIRVPYRGLLFFVGDAMGHGVQAALLMAVVKTALHGAITVADCSPAAVLGRVNRNLCSLVEGRFVTAVCGLLDPSSGTLDLAVAGHPYPWLVSWRDRGAQPVGQGALPLGLESAATFPEETLRLEPGDALVTFTDGLTEAQSPILVTMAQNGPPNCWPDTPANRPPPSWNGSARISMRTAAGTPHVDDLTILVLRTHPRAR